MPQFDQISFLNQIFWLLIIFYILYFIFTYYFFPQLLAILKYRKKVLRKKLIFLEQQQINILIIKKNFNNIYTNISLIYFQNKSNYLNILLQKLNIIKLYQNKTYNHNLFKILFLKKILNKF